MNRTQFFEETRILTQERTKLLTTKGKAYSGDDDAFANFKSEGDDLGLTKYQIWSVYAFKHIGTIKRAIKVNPIHPVDNSEGLRGRIKDAINYLELLNGMLKEDERKVEREVEKDEDPRTGH